MAGELALRRYERADAEAVWTLHERSLQADGWEFAEEVPPETPISEVAPEIAETFLERDGEFLVGHVDGELVAIGGFVPVDDGTVEIRRMAVHPDHQRRGYGERLLVELEERAAAAGYRCVTLETFERLEAAQALYEAHGYTERVRERHERTGDDRIRYDKEL